MDSEDGVLQIIIDQRNSFKSCQAEFRQALDGSSNDLSEEGASSNTNEPNRDTLDECSMGKSRGGLKSSAGKLSLKSKMTEADTIDD